MQQKVQNLLARLLPLSSNKETSCILISDALKDIYFFNGCEVCLGGKPLKTIMLRQHINKVITPEITFVLYNGNYIAIKLKSVITGEISCVTDLKINEEKKDTINKFVEIYFSNFL